MKNGRIYDENLNIWPEYLFMFIRHNDFGDNPKYADEHDDEVQDEDDDDEDEYEDEDEDEVEVEDGDEDEDEDYIY